MERKQLIHDSIRTEFLNSRGYRVFRLWNNDVLKNTEAVMSVIYENLNAQTDAAAPPPLTPPRRAQARGGRGTRNVED